MQYIVITFLLFFSLCSQAQDTAIIKTSAQCESCKSRLECRLGKEKGVQSSHLNIDSRSRSHAALASLLASKSI